MEYYGVLRTEYCGTEFCCLPYSVLSEYSLGKLTELSELSSYYCHQIFHTKNNPENNFEHPIRMHSVFRTEHSFSIDLLQFAVVHDRLA